MNKYLTIIFLGLLIFGCSGEDNENQDANDDQMSVDNCEPVTALIVPEISVSYLKVDFAYGGPVVRYDLEYGPIGFATGQGELVEDIAPYQRVEVDLIGNSDYEFYVISLCQDGATVNSERKSFTTDSCPIPNNITTFSVTGSSASIGWADLEMVNNYQVEYGPSGFEIGTGIVQNVTDRVAYFSGLEAGTTYQVYVRANCGGVFGEYSSAYSFTTAFNCNKPFNLQWTTISSSYIDLFWQSNGESAWQIEYGLVGFQPGTGTIRTTSTKPYRVNGLQNNTTYQFYIRAICTAGGYSERESIIVSTLEP